MQLNKRFDLPKMSVFLWFIFSFFVCRVVVKISQREGIKPYSKKANCASEIAQRITSLPLLQHRLLRHMYLRVKTTAPIPSECNFRPWGKEKNPLKNMVF